MPNDRLLTIAIVSYNSHNAIRSCMDELLRTCRHDIIVVDNASSDESGKLIKKSYPNVQLVQLDVNIGYGRAANRAIAATTTPYLLLLNPDMKATSASVDMLLSHMQSQGAHAAILAPAVTGKDHSQKGLLPRDWVIGAAMLLNLPLIRKIGAFDENIFLFSEETDLCYRVRAAGMDILLDSDLYIEHLAKQSSTPNSRIEYLKNWHIGWSHLYYYTKHGLAVGKKNPKRILALYALKYLLATKSAKRAQYKARLKGTLAFMRGEKAFLPNGQPQGRLPGG